MKIKDLELSLMTMNEDYVKQICSWQYDDQYKEYNLPSYNEIIKKGYSITIPSKWNNYICFVLSNNQLFAYINIVKREDNTVFIGIGIRPVDCGKGYGADILEYAIKEARKRFPNLPICLKVRSWNKRAIKLYQKCGFKIVKMIKEADNKGNQVEFVYMKQ